MGLSYLYERSYKRPNRDAAGEDTSSPMLVCIKIIFYLFSRVGRRMQIAVLTRLYLYVCTPMYI